jgi:hypothetical protein
MPKYGIYEVTLFNISDIEGDVNKSLFFLGFNDGKLFFSIFFREII